MLAGSASDMKEPNLRGGGVGGRWGLECMRGPGGGRAAAWGARRARRGCMRGEQPVPRQRARVLWARACGAAARRCAVMPRCGDAC